MELHYYTLKRQASELSVRFKETRIEASYTQKKNELILQVHDRDGDNGHLVMSTDPQYPFILSKSTQRRSKLSKDVMKDLLGKKIQGISILPGDRIIIVDFIPSHHRLLLQFFLKRTNFFIVNENYQIQEAFKQNKKFSGQIYSVPTAVAPEFTKISLEKFTSVLNQQSNKTLYQVLKKQFYELNNTILKEIEFSSALDLSAVVKATDEKQLKLLYNSIQEFLDQCLQNQPRVYLKHNSPYLFSLTELHQYQNLEVKTYDTTNDALTYFLFNKQKAEDHDKIVTNIKSLINSKLEQLEHLIRKLNNLPDEQEQREYYQKIGELLLAQMLSIPEGSSQIRLTDLFDPEQPEISVTLNPELSVQENAQKYFNRAKRVAENRRQVRQNLKSLKIQQEDILNFQAILDKPLDWKALKRVEKRLQEMYILQTDGEKLQEIYKPYKQYFYQGWKIWIGKSARDNDELTFRKVNKEDIWMHAQGVSGSHVIIRSKKSTTTVPQKVLFYAAQLAAGKSKAKHSGYVPVIYTKVKYVRKPKGSAPGEVSAERVKSIFAEPLIS